MLERRPCYHGETETVVPLRHNKVKFFICRQN